MQHNRPLTIVIDFDDTLVSYTDNQGFFPLPGAVEATRELKRLGHRIIIYSCRFALAKMKGKLREETVFVSQILMDFGIEFDELHLEDKPIADFYVDDRAVSFKGDWPVTLQKLLTDE